MRASFPQFTYLFVLRAVAKAGPELDAAFSNHVGTSSNTNNDQRSTSFSTADPADDAKARALVRALVYPDHPLIDTSLTHEAQTCQRGFDETRLFDASSFASVGEGVDGVVAVGGGGAAGGGDGGGGADSFDAAVAGRKGEVDSAAMEDAAFRAMELRREVRPEEREGGREGYGVGLLSFFFCVLPPSYHAFLGDERCTTK